MKKLFGVILVMLLILCLAPSVFAAENIIDEGICGDSLTWKIAETYSNTTLTISGSGEMDYDAYLNWEDYNKTVDTIIIDEGVTSVTDDAFYGFKFITEIKIPDSVTTVGMYAFEDCVNLETVDIGKGAVIENFAFQGCSSLEKILVSSENENYTSVDGVLFNKDKTTLVRFPSYWIDTNNCYGEENGVSTDYTLPDSVTSINYDAFEGKIHVKNFYTVKNSAFTAEDGILFNKDKTALVRYPIADKRIEYTVPGSVISIDPYAFSYSENLISVSLPQELKTISDSLFLNCENLKSAEIPNTVEDIQKHAFSGCISLEKIKLPFSLKSINIFAFSGCSSLTSADIPRNVSNIGAYAFKGCENLENVTFRNMGTVNSYSFANCENLKQINVFSNSILIANDAFFRCGLIEDIYFAVSEDKVFGEGEYEENKVILDYNEALIDKNVYFNTPCTVSLVYTDSSSSCVSVTPQNISGSANIIIAFYKNGRLADTKVCTVSDANAETDKDFDTVKIMTFDSLKGIKPLCDKEEY